MYFHYEFILHSTTEFEQLHARHFTTTSMFRYIPNHDEKLNLIRQKFQIEPIKMYLTFDMTFTNLHMT